jgi:hypothetical protein
MLNIFYTTIIYPLVQIIEVIYRTGHKLFENTGLAIICVSLAVTFLCLPLYVVAEKCQQLEQGLAFSGHLVQTIIASYSRIVPINRTLVILQFRQLTL